MISSRRLFSTACLLLLLAACKPPETAVQRGDRTQTLELGNLTEPTDLDPQVINSSQDFNIVFTLLEGLTTPDAKDLHPTPGAAQGWDISPDGTVYTFHLRPNAKWSDGAPVTADDFLFAYRRMLSPKLASEYSYMLYVMKNAEAYNTGQTHRLQRRRRQGSRPSDAPDHPERAHRLFPLARRAPFLVSPRAAGGRKSSGGGARRHR